MSLKDIIYKGVETVSVLYPEREAREMVFAYLEDTLGIKRYTHVIKPDCRVADDSAAEAVEAFRRMASGEPLQYITGSAWFYGRKFRVTPDVLIPRPETELLVNSILSQSAGAKCSDGPLPAVAEPLPLNLLPQAAYSKSPQGCLPIVCEGGNLLILDLCTGSGCIAWTLALEMPGTRVIAADLSEGALSVASSQDFSEEISRTGAVPPVFIKTDVLKDRLDFSAGIHASETVRFDIIVSNPPYVMDSEKAFMRPNVLDHEPHFALFVPDDDPLKFYRAIASHSVRLLSENGLGIVEINEALGEATAETFRSAGFHARVLQDLSGKDRFVRYSRRKYLI